MYYGYKYLLKTWTQQDVLQENESRMDRVEKLIRRLKKGWLRSGLGRKGAAEKLGKIGDSRGIKPLIAALNDKKVKVCISAEKALLLIGKPAVKSLVKALADNDCYSKQRVAAVLDKIGWKPSNNSELALYLVAKQEWNRIPALGKDAIGPVINVLEDWNPHVLREAAAALGKIGDPGAVGPLINVLKNRDPEVRREVAAALGNIGDSSAVGPLIDAMRDDTESGVREKAFEALTKIGKPAVEPLIKALKDKDCAFRKKVAEVLDKIGWKPSNNIELALYFVAKQQWDELPPLNKDAVEPLINVLKDENLNVRRNATEALGKIGDPRAVGHLINALKDMDPGVRDKAAEALARIGKPSVESLVKALKDLNCNFRKRAAEVLDNIGWKPSNDRESALYLVAKQEWDKLPGLGKIAVEPLINVLEDKEPLVRREVVVTLGEIGDSRAVKPLTNALLKDTDSVVRENAAVALGKIGAPGAVEPLVNALKDTNSSVRDKAAEALVKIGKPSVEPLINAMKNIDSNVRDKAAGTLVKIGKPSVEPLIDALRDKNSHVRKKIVETLGKIGDPKAVGPLIDILNDNDFYVTGEVVEVLIKIGDARALEPLIEYYKDQPEKAKEVVGRIQPKIPDKDLSFICRKCLCRFKKHRAKISLFKTIPYYACRNCHSNSYLIKGIESIVVLLDKSFNIDYPRDSRTLTVNWFNRNEPFDFDEIWIINASDYEVEKFVMKLRNDMDEKRRKRMSRIPVYLLSGLKLSLTKKNMLKDRFKKIEVKNIEVGGEHVGMDK